MCGLFGVIKKHGTFYNESQELLYPLFLTSIMRGQHGAGLVTVSAGGSAKYAKSAGTPIDLFRTPQFAEMKDSIKDATMVYGHCRAATRGVISDDNAHPFVVDRIIVVHNGTLENSFVDKQEKKTDVDSELIAHGLAGVVNPIDYLKTIHGAYALIWYDMEAKTLNVARNTQRPLYLADTGAHWIMASEQESLRYATAKAKVNTKIEEFFFAPFSLYTFSLNSRNRYSLEKYEEQIPKPHYDVGGWSNYNGYWEREEYTGKKKDKSSLVVVSNKELSYESQQQLLPDLTLNSTQLVELVAVIPQKGNSFRVQGVIDGYDDVLVECYVPPAVDLHEKVFEFFSGRIVNIRKIDKRHNGGYTHKVIVDQFEPLYNEGTGDIQHVATQTLEEKATGSQVTH